MAIKKTLSIITETNTQTRKLVPGSADFELGNPFIPASNASNPKNATPVLLNKVSKK